MARSLLRLHIVLLCNDYVISCVPVCLYALSDPTLSLPSDAVLTPLDQEGVDLFQAVPMRKTYYYSYRLSELDSVYGFGTE